MDIAYIKKVQEWVELDNILLKSKEETQDSVDKKKDIEGDILNYVEKHNIEFNLAISDGHIKFAKRNTNQALSMKVIKTLLGKYFSTVEKAKLGVDVDDICEFLTSNLEKKTVYFMKRDIQE